MPGIKMCDQYKLKRFSHFAPSHRIRTALMNFKAFMSVIKRWMRLSGRLNIIASSSRLLRDGFTNQK